MVSTLLEPILPNALRRAGSNDPGAKRGLLAWLDEIQSLNSEELAWNYLRNGSSTNDQNFTRALGFLIAKGGPGTQAELQQVFLDPVLWKNGAVVTTLFLLPKYLAAYKGDKAAFGEKILATTNEALTEMEQANHRYSAGSEDAAEKKREEAQKSQLLAQLDQILHPRGLGELIAKAAESTDEDPSAAVQPVKMALCTAVKAAAERDLIQGAAKAKTFPVKSGLLALARQALRTPRNISPPPPAPKLPDDPPTRAALLALLDDDTLPPPAARSPSAAEFTVSDLAARMIISPRLAPAEIAFWEQLAQQAPDLADRLFRAHARALAGGTPPPPKPNSSKVSAARTDAFIKELGALPTGKVLPAFKVKTPDEQLALTIRLAEVKEWPPALVAAQMTIVACSGAKGGQNARRSRLLEGKTARRCSQAGSGKSRCRRPASTATASS